MKKLILLLIILVGFLSSGCVGKKTAIGNAFYSTNSPSMTLKFNEGMEYIGEKRYKEGPVSVQAYYYSTKNEEKNIFKGTWIDFLTVHKGYYLYPKHLPVGNVLNSAIYTKHIGNDRYYCRMFITQPNPKGHPESHFISQGHKLPHYSVVRLCSKLISEKKKIILGYVTKIDEELVNKLVYNKSYKPIDLTTEQIDFFDSFDENADKAITFKKFEESYMNVAP